MIESLVAIAFLHWLILLTPGPNVLLISALAAAGETRSAVYASIGVTAVAGIWAGFAAAGVHTIFAAHPLLRTVIQSAGAIYLIYMAIRLWNSNPAVSKSEPEIRGCWSAFRLGFVTNLGNPKSALFFASVFATSLPEQHGKLLPLLAIIVVLSNALAWHLLLAALFSRPLVRKLYKAKAKLLNQIAGILVGVFALRLVVDTWRVARTT